MKSRPFVKAMAAFALSLFLSCIAVCARGENSYYSGEPKFRVTGYNNISLIKTSVRVENFTVSVKHAFKNKARHRAGLVFTLDAPSFANIGDGSPYPDRSYSDLLMSLDGKRVLSTKNSQALVNGRDVTGTLASMGLKPNDLGLFDNQLEKRLRSSENLLARLKSQGLVNAQGRPTWSAKNEYAFKTELAPNASAVFHYVYTALPGIFYIEPEEPERAEIVKLIGTRWSTLQNAFGGVKQTQGFNILRVMQLPLWADSWQQPADQLEIHVSMSSVGDKSCLLTLLLDGQTYSGQGGLRLVLNKYTVKGPAWLVVYSPFGVH